MNVAIVAGEPAFHRHLQSELRQHCFHADFRSFYTAEMFFRILKYSHFDLVFLDEDIPDQDGLAVSEKLRETDENCLIVFVTDHMEIIQKAFGSNVAAFITKKQLDTHAGELVKKLRSELARKQHVVLETSQRRTIRLRVSDIIYADLYCRHVIVHTRDKSYRLKRAALKEVFALMPENSFVYISRFCFVNLSKIQSVSRGKLYLEGVQEPFLMSRGCRTALKKQII